MKLYELLEDLGVKAKINADYRENEEADKLVNLLYEKTHSKMEKLDFAEDDILSFEPVAKIIAKTLVDGGYIDNLDKLESKTTITEIADIEDSTKMTSQHKKFADSIFSKKGFTDFYTVSIMVAIKIVKLLHKNEKTKIDPYILLLNLAAASVLNKSEDEKYVEGYLLMMIMLQFASLAIIAEKQNLETDEEGNIEEEVIKEIQKHFKETGILKIGDRKFETAGELLEAAEFDLQKETLSGVKTEFNKLIEDADELDDTKIGKNLHFPVISVSYPQMVMDKIEDNTMLFVIFLIFIVIIVAMYMYSKNNS